MEYLVGGGLVYVFVVIVSITAVIYGFGYEEDIKQSLLSALKYTGVATVVIGGIICATALLAKGVDVMGI